MGKLRYRAGMWQADRQSQEQNCQVPTLRPCHDPKPCSSLPAFLLPVPALPNGLRTEGRGLGRAAWPQTSLDLLHLHSQHQVSSNSSGVKASASPPQPSFLPRAGLFPGKPAPLPLLSKSHAAQPHPALSPSAQCKQSPAPSSHRGCCTCLLSALPVIMWELGSHSGGYLGVSWARLAAAGRARLGVRHQPQHLVSLLCPTVQL